MAERQVIEYTPLPTLKKFHESSAIHRCCCGPVGSGKTSAVAVEFGYYLPMWIFENYGIKNTRWIIIRNTYCYDDQTEVLTDSGWRLFKDLTKNDRVATLKDGKTLEFETPTAHHVFDYDGEMVGIKNEGVDLLTTPNHNYYVSGSLVPFSLIPALEIYGKNCFMKNTDYRVKISSENWRNKYYKGRVYCVTAGSGIIYVRRNGKAVWCGNSELKDSTQRSIFENWFPWGKHQVQREIYTFGYPNGVKVEFWFRACDRPDDVKKFKSVEATGAWFEESIEIDGDIKRLVKNRIGRYPKKCPVKFSVESTNPPDVEHELFSMYKWIVPPPDVVPTKQPLEDHEGFWQPPYENAANLQPGYYEDLKRVYRDSPEFYDMYVLGKPGAMVHGKLVYYDFVKEKHVSKVPLVWAKGRLYRGWDNTGNSPACLVVQMAGHDKVQVLKEFYSDRMGILDFAQWVVVECNQLYPGAEYTDYADPAGESKMSNPLGGLTSNGDMMRNFGISVIPSEQNWEARRESVQRQIRIENGLLVDPTCTRYINGFIAGYSYPQIGTTGVYKDRPAKNRYSHIHDAGQYVFVKIFRSVAASRNAITMANQQRQFLQRRDIAGL